VPRSRVGFLGPPTQVHTPNGTLIGSAVLECVGVQQPRARNIGNSKQHLMLCIALQLLTILGQQRINCVYNTTTVVYLVSNIQSFGIPSPTHSFFSRFKTFLFCKSFPLQPFLFYSSGFSTWILQTVCRYFVAYLFSTFSFSVFTIFSCRFRAVD